MTEQRKEPKEPEGRFGDFYQRLRQRVRDSLRRSPVVAKGQEASPRAETATQPTTAARPDGDPGEGRSERGVRPHPGVLTHTGAGAEPAVPPSLRARLVEYVALLPDLFHLATRLLLDRSVPLRRKAPLAAAVAYLVSPLDLVTDAIPVLGWLDDLAVIAWALRRVLRSDDPAVQAAVARHWAGEADALQTVEKALNVVTLITGALSKRPGR